MKMQSMGVVRGYHGLIAAIRARKEQMKISDTDLEELAGLTRGHVSKLLARGARKTLGPLSMGRLLRALGLELLVVENAEQTARMRELYTKRKEGQVRNRAMPAIASILDAPWLLDGKKATEIRANQASRQSAKQRRRIARIAANARWRKERKRRRESRVARRASEGAAECQR